MLAGQVHRIRRTALVAPLIALALLAGCGSDAKDLTSATTTTIAGTTTGAFSGKSEGTIVPVGGIGARLRELSR